MATVARSPQLIVHKGRYQSLLAAQESLKNIDCTHTPCLKTTTVFLCMQEFWDPFAYFPLPLASESLIFACVFSIHFAKCKSYPNHFLALTCSALNPGFPYVNGKKKNHPPSTAAITSPEAPQSASMPCWLNLSFAGTTTLFPVLSLFFDGDLIWFVCWRKFSSRPTGSRLNMNSSKAPQTREEAR